MKIEEENRKLNKIRTKEEMKSFLESQMEEKKLKMTIQQTEDKNYVNHIRSSLEKFNLEQKIKDQKKKEEIMKYKEELELQCKAREEL